MSARQGILAGQPTPVFMNQNGNRQAIVGPAGVFLNETGGAGPAPPGTTTQFYSPICNVGHMMNHSS